MELSTQIMKPILTTIVIFVFTALSFAQEVKLTNKTSDTIKESSTVDAIQKSTTKVEEDQMVRLYMFKNSRIKKELAFKTIRNKTKIA
ncbi:Hypothetical protein I595_2226 [Croceitalea dokdonensis DOKDO 023]|uniref:Uncharacterized protein n=2 Tax=Croceitalea TaxID=574891 RepID=A0A0P7AIW5_9FLAO|nr:Hypothetical protein I595_2226 [Croceitalea dokdonensis DOKDO 023]